MWQGPGHEVCIATRSTGSLVMPSRSSSVSEDLLDLVFSIRAAGTVAQAVPGGG